ncbi:MAG: hypothetical protein ACF8LL_12320 [Phycisphaerales bacterium]
MIEVTVYGDASIGSHLLGGAFGLEVARGAEFVTDITWTNNAWSAFNTDGGYDGNGTYNQVSFGQLVIPGIFPPAPGSELGSAIGFFEVEVDFHGGGILELELVQGTPFTLETVDSVSGQTYRDDGSNISLGSTSIWFCPSPGTSLAFGFFGLAASCRRR